MLKIFTALVLLLSVTLPSFAGEQSAKNLTINDYANCYMTFTLYSLAAKENGNAKLVQAYEHFQLEWLKAGVNRFGEGAVVAAYEDKNLKNEIANTPDKQLSRIKDACLDYAP